MTALYYFITSCACRSVICLPYLLWLENRTTGHISYCPYNWLVTDTALLLHLWFITATSARTPPDMGFLNYRKRVSQRIPASVSRKLNVECNIIKRKYLPIRPTLEFYLCTLQENIIKYVVNLFFFWDSAAVNPNLWIALQPSQQACARLLNTICCIVCLYVSGSCNSL
jgi:hypothetical protein